MSHQEVASESHRLVELFGGKTNEPNLFVGEDAAVPRATQTSSVRESGDRSTLIVTSSSGVLTSRPMDRTAANGRFPHFEK